MNIICFALYDVLWGQSKAQALILKILKEKKENNIIYLSCMRYIQGYCNAMANRIINVGAPARLKDKVCEECCANSKLVTKSLKIELKSLDEVLQQPPPSNTNKSKLIRWSFYESIILTKGISRNLNQTGKIIFEYIVNNSKKLSGRIQEALDLEKPSLALTQHTAYTYNRLFNDECKKRDIPCYSINNSLNLSHSNTSALLFRDSPIDFYRQSIKDWPKYKNIPLNENEVLQCISHLRSLMNGKGFAYSRKIVKQLGRINQNKTKHICVFLSSYDELMASKFSGLGLIGSSKVFKDQLEWIRWIFKFAEKEKNWKFTIRPHPREFVVDQAGEISEHAKQLIRAFKEKPKNVIINMPDDEVAAYDLLYDSDIVLFSWSTVGLEASMLGIPAITYFPQALLHPSELVVTAQNKKELERNIIREACEGWSISRSVQALRWVNYLYNASSVELVDKKSFLKKLAFKVLKNLPLNKELKRKLEIELSCTASKEKRQINEMFLRGDRSLQSLYFKARERENQSNEIKNVKTSLNMLFTDYLKLSGKKSCRYQESAKELFSKSSKL